MRLLLVIILITIRIFNSNACDSEYSIKTTVFYNYGSETKHLCYGILKDDPSVYKVKYNNCLFSIKTGTISRMNNLIAVNMENMCIKEIAENFTKATPKLKTINLKSNQLSKIEKWVFYGTNVKFLDLSFNKIDTIEKFAFADMALNRLDLQYNNLKQIDEAWFDSSSIKELILANNKIIRLQTYVFGPVTEIQHLNLNSNNIHIIDEDIGMEHIDSLTISRNVLSDLKFLEQTKVSSLDISYNRFSYLHPSQLIWLNKIVLEPNPWHCSCLHQFWKDNVNIGITVSYSTTNPICTMSKQKNYACKYEMDEDIFQSQDYYFELVDYAKMIT